MGSGKHVVTSNKEVIAKHGMDFLKIAREKNVNLYFEAAVGGGIPVVHALKNSLAANNISKVVGIMNGTTNFILSKMSQDGAEFETVLKEAQALGFAEADPSDDVDGYDVAYKLSILASIAFNTHFKYEDIYFEGIRKITARDIDVARKMGNVIKLIAYGKEHDNGVELRVHPVMISESHPLAGVNGCFNAVFIEGDSVGETMFYGQGAGELPTASAVVGDVLDIVMHWELPHSHPSIATNFSEKKALPICDTFSEFCLRIKVKDEPGVLGAVSGACGKSGVSIKSIEQQEPVAGHAELVIVTHRFAEKLLQAAVKDIDSLKSVVEVSSLIRVGL